MSTQVSLGSPGKQSRVPTPTPPPGSPPPRQAPRSCRPPPSRSVWTPARPASPCLITGLDSGPSHYVLCSSTSLRVQAGLQALLAIDLGLEDRAGQGRWWQGQSAQVRQGFLVAGHMSLWVQPGSLEAPGELSTHLYPCQFLKVFPLLFISVLMSVSSH